MKFRSLEVAFSIIYVIQLLLTTAVLGRKWIPDRLQQVEKSSERSAGKRAGEFLNNNDNENTHRRRKNQDTSSLVEGSVT